MKALPMFISAMLTMIAYARADEAVPGAKPPPEQIVVIKARNQEIVTSAKNTSGVFTVEDSGDIKHLQSGMVCPAFFPNMNFYSALNFSAEPGLDVGCDYRRADDLGGASAKLTIFAVKAGADVTLEAAFAGYRSEIMQSMPDAKSLGVALRSQSSTDLGFRSEEFSITFNHREYTTQLFVELKSGWIIEVRTTFVGKPNVIEVAKEDGANAIGIAMGDRVMGAMALMSAEKSLGQ